MKRMSLKKREKEIKDKENFWQNPVEESKKLFQREVAEVEEKSPRRERKEKATRTPSVVVIDGPASSYVEAGIAAAIGATVSVVGFYILSKIDKKKKMKENEELD